MVIVNSPKGRELFDSSQVIHKIEADYEMLVSGNPNIENVRIKEKERDGKYLFQRADGLQYWISHEDVGYLLDGEPCTDEDF